MATLPNTNMRVKLLSDRLIGGNHTKQGTVIDVDDQTARSLVFATLATETFEEPVVEDEKPLTAAQKKALAKAEAEAKAKAEADAKAQAEAEAEAAAAAQAKAEAPKEDATDDPLAAAIADAETKKGE